MRLAAHSSSTAHRVVSIVGNPPEQGMLVTWSFECVNERLQRCAAKEKNTDLVNPRSLYSNVITSLNMFDKLPGQAMKR